MVSLHSNRKITNTRTEQTQKTSYINVESTWGLGWEWSYPWSKSGDSIFSIQDSQPIWKDVRQNRKEKRSMKESVQFLYR